MSDAVTGAPLRVTVVNGAGVLGGAERWLLALLAATDRLSVDAVVLARGPFVDELSRLGIPVRVLPTGRRPAELAAAVLQLVGLLRRDRGATDRPDSRVDLVLANGVKAAALAAPAAMLAGVRCVWVKHDHSFDGRPVARVAARLVDGVVATSPTLAQAVGPARAYAAGRAGGVVVVVPPRAVRPPLPREPARAVLARFGVDPADPRPVFAVVGRLVRYKGVEDAVRALAWPGGAGWRLAVIGGADPAEPGERDRLGRLAVAEGVADRVVFTGTLPDAARLLTGVDAVGVLTKPVGRGAGPSREGFGTVALEAMLAGVPVVATHGGPVVARLAGRAGLGVPPGDPGAVAAALGRLADPTQRAAMGSAGRQLAAGHPDPRTCADLLVRELCRVAVRPGAGRRDGPPVSVVTTVLDDADGVHRLLARLAGQLADAADEVVVVDGGSRDSTVDRVRAWSARDPRIRLVVEAGAGISAGRNAGVRAARNNLVACIDAGCDPVPGWLAAFRRAAADAASPPGAGLLLTGVYRASADQASADRAGADRARGSGGPGPVQAAAVAVGYPDPDELRRPSLLVRVYGRLLGRSFDAARPTGRSMAFDVQTWRAVGGFPEHLQTGEDVLFGQSIVATGAPATLVVDAEVGWAQRPTLWATARMYYRYGQGSGRSRDRRLLGRDLARLAAYLAAAGAVARGGPAGRVAVAAAGLGYLSLPLVRVLRRASPGPVARPEGVVGRLAATVAVPVVAVVRDVAKASGALGGLLRKRRHGMRRPPAASDR